MLDGLEDIISSILIQPWYSLFWVAIHRVCFPWACLPKGENSSFVPCKCMTKNWPNVILIQFPILHMLINDSIEAEGVFIYVFGEVQLDSEYHSAYFGYLTMMVFRTILTLSVYLLLTSLSLRGLFLIITWILGISIQI